MKLYYAKRNIFLLLQRKNQSNGFAETGAENCLKKENDFDIAASKQSKCSSDPDSPYLQDFTTAISLT